MFYVFGIIIELVYILLLMLIRKLVLYIGFIVIKLFLDFILLFKNNWFVFNIIYNLFVKSFCMFLFFLCVFRWFLLNFELGEVGVVIGGRWGSLFFEFEWWDCLFFMDIWDGKNKLYDWWIKKKIILELKNVKGMCMVRYLEKVIGSVL